MKRSVVFMFSGQGSQYYHFAKALYEQHPIFRMWMKRLDTMASELVGESLCDKIYNRKKKIKDSFDQTIYSHPAIFMVEYALAQVLINEGIEPDFVLGTSLGEFASATVSGILSLEDAIELVIEQARVIENCCQKGNMLAVLKNEFLFYYSQILYENSELVAVNYSSHFTIAQKNEHINKIAEYLKNNHILFQKLPVSHAFHSSLMDPAEDVYKNALERITYRLPKVSFVSCVYTDILKTIPKDYFWDIVRKPILFQDVIQHLEKIGKFDYIDLGPSGTLATFVKNNLSANSKSKSFSIITPFGNELKNIERIKKSGVST